MDNKLYRLMNWPEIESIVYSECDHPERILGMHECGSGYLIQTYQPGATSVSIKNLQNNTLIDMECVDEEGFFAQYVPAKTVFSYEYIVSDEKGDVRTLPEVYEYIPKFWGALSEKLDAGILYDAYRYFGGHFCERKGVLGTEFMTYAPGAERVSVVGNFNGWDGRTHQMCRLTDSGVFALFIPGLAIGELYKFEIKLPNSLTFLKRDPFALELEKGLNDASIVVSEPDWEVPSKHCVMDTEHFSLLNISLHTLFKECNTTEEALDKMLTVIDSYGYTGIIFEDINVCRGKNVCKDFSIALMATDSDCFDADSIKNLVSGLHNKGISVLVNLELASYIPDKEGLCGFDGTSLYGNTEKLVDNRYTYNFNSRFLRNYLISVCDFYLKTYAFDGIVVGGTDRILYLDYGKNEGEWRPNIYGGNESVDGYEFIKHLNSILHIRHPKTVTIAADSLYSNNLTLDLKEYGLGFDFKLHSLFDRDLIAYMSLSTREKSAHHPELTYSPVYIYCEKFILTLDCHDYGNDDTVLCKRFPVHSEDNLRLLISYFFMHPGRKNLPFTDMKDEKLISLVKDLNGLYFSKPYLDSEEDNVESFEWINAIDSTHSVISFMRTSASEDLLVVANFSASSHAYELGVKKGTYTCVFDTVNGVIKQPAVYSTVAGKKDGRRDKLSIKLAPLCLYVFKYCP